MTPFERFKALSNTPDLSHLDDFISNTPQETLDRLSRLEIMIGHLAKALLTEQQYNNWKTDVLEEVSKISSASEKNDDSPSRNPH